jgi:hypothetical protein
LFPLNYPASSTRTEIQKLIINQNAGGKMKIWPMKPLIAVVVAIVVCLILYAYISRSPYIFGVGITLGIYLADASTMKAGAIYGATISFPLSLYIVINNIFNDNLAGSSFYTPLNVILIIAFGTLYGAALVWVKNKIVGGTRFG